MLGRNRLVGPAAPVAALSLWLCPGALAATPPASACPVSHTTSTTAACPQVSDTTPAVGGTVSATAGEWTGTEPISHAFQWQRCDSLSEESCANLPGENETSYVVSPEAQGKRLRVVVTASNEAGTAVRKSAIAGVVSASPSNTPGYNQVFPPTIAALPPGSASSPVVGDTLRVMEGTEPSAFSDGWFNPKATTIAFAWRRCAADGALETCVTIPGATEREYTLVPADGGHSLRARVTGSSSGNARALITPPTGSIPPVPDGGGSGSPSGADTVPPTIASLTLSPKAFHAARFGPSISAIARGTTVTYQLSEQAQVTYRVELAARGVKRGGRCVKRKRSTPAKAKSCKRYVPLQPPFAEEADEGENSFRFTGRLGGKTLRPGNYRLGTEASDAAGNRTAAPIWREFTILPPARKAAGRRRG